jgi:hypothetical protein
MKKILKFSNVLSWINLVAGSLLVLGGLFLLRYSPDGFTILVSVVLPGAVILHSYVAFQLRKSILNSAIPLTKQAPVGVRLMGFMALFFAIISISNAFIILQHAPEVSKQIKLPVQSKDLDVVSILRGSGIFTLVISISIVTNVVLNFRLLKWYLFYKEKENEAG